MVKTRRYIPSVLYIHVQPQLGTVKACLKLAGEHGIAQGLGLAQGDRFLGKSVGVYSDVTT